MVLCFFSQASSEINGDDPSPSIGFEPRVMEDSQGSVVNSSVLVNLGAVIVPILVLGLLSNVLQGKKRKQRGVPVEVGGEKGYAVRNAKGTTQLLESPQKVVTTVAALFEQSCKKHSENRCLGTRKLIGREFVTDSDGRKIEKLHLGDYGWQTYGQVFDRACNFASGLIKLGHNVDTRAAIYADTRAEWFIAFQGCFRQKITVVTIYSSLGEDALIHSLNETQVSTLICDSKHLTKLATINSSLNSIKNVIYFEDDGGISDANECGSTSHWRVASFSEVEKLGQESPVHPSFPSKNDIAVIMYTSGSTGLPKGVMITHGNVVATAASMMIVLPNLSSTDIYLAYLPLAHVFELASESVFSAIGAQIGYGSASTLTDTSSKLKKGTKGDAPLLKPTIIITVPAIIDRIRDGVLTKVEEKGWVAKNLFNIGLKRRLAAVGGSWFGAWGLERMFWDNIVFKNIRLLLGGRLRYISSGGAPLSADSQQFINICFGALVRPAYGMTETFGGATVAEGDDTTVGRVGPPVLSCYIKLVSWNEGGYFTSDKPMPRGEIVVGGPCVTAGYFNNQQKTDEVYKVDENGMRWFYTGDIGRFHPDGCLEIIDRKKDIVKLQHGEYISLGKIEAALRLSNYVENIMAYADPYHTYCIAVVVPVRQELENWAREAGINYNNDFSELCGKAVAISEVQQSLSKVAKAGKLSKFEIPGKIYLAPEPWTPESGLVTAALKIKREPIKSKFKSEMEKLYA